MGHTPHTYVTGETITASVLNQAEADLAAALTAADNVSADKVVDGTTNKAYTATEKTKLAGVATGATANVVGAAGSGATNALSANDATTTNARTPTAHAHPIADLTATGTRDATTFLRGDGTWATPAGGSGGPETATVIAASGASQTLTLDTTNVGTWDVTLTAATVALTFAGATNGKAATITLLARQDATGGRTITWPGTVTWVGGAAPVLSSAAGAVDVLTFLSINGGTTWFGLAGSSSASSWKGRSTGWFRQAAVTTAQNFTQSTMGAYPLDVGAVTLTALAMQVTTAVASGVVRLGIYGDSGGVPGPLLVDAGTVDASTTGVKTSGAISVTTTGRVWIAFVAQGAGPIGATAVQGQGAAFAIGYDTAANALGFTPNGYNATGSVTGALPATFPVSNATTTVMAVAARVA